MLSPARKGFAIARFRCGAALLCLALPAAMAGADSVSVRLADDPNTPMVYPDVKVVSAGDGKITFTTATGTSVTKDLASVVQMQLQDEPTFNQAESDFASGRYQEATDEFDQVIQKTVKPWLKTYCQPTLTDAADKAGQFDKAVAGFISLIMDQPGIALQHRPTIPPPGSTYLDPAATELSAAVDATGVTREQQVALLAYLLEVDRARNDAQAVDAVATRLEKTAGNSTDPAAGLAALALGDAKLTEARQALNAKDYTAAAKIINDGKALFTDPNRQADALYILAQTAEEKAQARGGEDDWRDAAIAYLRVVANFKDAAAAPHVADSLLKAAAILERLNQPAQALEMYKSVQSRFPHTPAAERAAKEADRLASTGH